MAITKSRILIAPLFSYGKKEAEVILEAILQIAKESKVDKVLTTAHYGLWDRMEKAGICTHVLTANEERLFFERYVMSHVIKSTEKIVNAEIVASDYCSERLLDMFSKAAAQNEAVIGAAVSVRANIVIQPMHLGYLYNVFMENFKRDIF